MNNIGVYQIKINDKIYVGSTTQSFKIRYNSHLNQLRNNKHINRHLQNSYNKYGEDKFEFSILEIVQNSEYCIPCEQKWIDKLNPELNISPTAGSNLGHKLSEETKRKISDSQKGKNLGKKRTEETIRKLSQSHIGKQNALGSKRSNETRQKLSQMQKGRKLLEKTKIKIGLASIGNKNCLGKKWSEETKKRLSEANIWKKSIICINTGEVFSSITEASNYYNMKSRSSISMCCNNIKKSAGKHPITGEKLIWEYNKIENLGDTSERTRI